MAGTAAAQVKTKISYGIVFVSSPISIHEAVHEEQLRLYRLHFDVYRHQRGSLRFSSLQIPTLQRLCDDSACMW